MKSKLLLTSMTTILGLYGVLIFFLLIVFNITGWSLSYLLVISILVFSNKSLNPLTVIISSFLRFEIFFLVSVSCLCLALELRYLK